MNNEEILKKICNELKELAKLPIPIPMSIYDPYAKAPDMEMLHPGKSCELIRQTNICIKFDNPLQDINNHIKLTVVKERKQGDKIVINNEQ